jgi:hypothetical protein
VYVTSSLWSVRLSVPATGGFLQIGLSLFFLAIFMLCVVILTMVLKQRLE